MSTKFDDELLSAIGRAIAVHVDECSRAIRTDMQELDGVVRHLRADADRRMDRLQAELAELRDEVAELKRPAGKGLKLAG